MNRPQTGVTAKRGHFYTAFWRWHFYAGLFVIPFLFILAVSGMLMLLSKPVENVLYRDLLYVTPGQSALTASQQQMRVQNAYPDSRIALYIPPGENVESARFSLVPVSYGGGHSGHGIPSKTVYINPYSGEILGELDPAKTLYARIKTLHGTLYMGNIGDALIEIAAGLAVLMLLTGVYLAWPVDGWRSVLPVKRLKKRSDWRRFHGCVGLLVAVPLLFFLLSGLAWTNVWGGKLVQAWSSLSVTNYATSASKSTPTHDSMNQHGQHQVPWVLEQVPMPESGSGSVNHRLTMDEVLHIASKQGLGGRYRVQIPDEHTEVWTVSTTTMAGDTKTPSEERTIHLDRVTGEVLADIRFAEYPTLGKAMAAFIPIHQGDLGGWNFAINLFFCVLIIVLIVSGFVLWLKRIPKTSHKLVAPATPKYANRVVLLGMLVVGLCFPLSAAVIAAATLLGWFLTVRAKA